MKRLLLLAGLCLLAAAAMSPSVAGARATSRVSTSRSISARLPSAPANFKAVTHLTTRLDWKAPNHVSTKAAMRQSAALTTVQMWSRKQSDGGTTFTYSMVGRNPFVAETFPSTTVPTVLVSVDFNNGGDHFSAFASDPCDPSGASAQTRLLNSPIFKNKAYTWGGTSVSPVGTQITDAFQRANFAKYTINPGAVNPGYHVKLGLNTTLHDLTVNTSGWPEVAGTCGSIVEVDFATWDSFVQGEISTLGLNSTQFVLFQTHDMVLTSGGQCCILGYHSAFGSPVQTYGISDYDTTGLFANAPDISVTTHEVAEWMDDPLGNNPTKPWGHIGQVSGCQGNLEVGDPLSGTTFPVPLNGFRYHAQELAFFSWFYHQHPSIGINGWYSDQGTFTTPAAACS
jgi:hypothetical protein